MAVAWSSYVSSRMQQTCSRCKHRLLQRTKCRAVKSTETPEQSRPWTNHLWNWNHSGRDHEINYAVAGCGPPVILVHGFGASCGQWRKNIPELSKSHQVYAIDLLGFGASEKSLMNYTIELWADLLSDFSKEFVDQPFVLVGNSIGSLVSLQAAKSRRDDGDAPQPCGVALINCAGGMNNKARMDDWRIRLVYPLFLLLDIVLKIEIIAARLFNSFRTAENVREVLKSVYINSTAVDDELVDLICKPADDPNALAVLVSVLTGPPGPKPEDLMKELDVPVLVLWGDSDVLTPVDVWPATIPFVHMFICAPRLEAFRLAMSIARNLLQGPVGKFFMNLPSSKPNVTFELLKNTGHCTSPRL